jgi:CCR4-NOT transcription complex subunit 1
MFFNIRSDWGIIVLWYVLQSHQPSSSEVQDKVAFIINNIVTATTLDHKAKKCLEVSKEQYYPWFAQYMAMKR